MAQERQPDRVTVEEGAVLQAARELAAALVDTPEYRAFEAAQGRLRSDAAAQEAIRSFQARQRELGWQLQVGLVSEEEREALRQLQQAMLAQPAVQAYLEAQSRLSELCQEVVALISEEAGVNLLAGSGPGCC